jgi:hypothetical protein
LRDVVECDVRRGMYRIPGVGDRPNDVRVDDDGISVPVEESLYRNRGYEPSVDDLPWRDDYLSQQDSANAKLPATEAQADPARAAFRGGSVLAARTAPIFRRYETR